MKIYRITSDCKGGLCGGYGKPKGHLDTQMFPECKGKPGDRDVVKKTRERRNKGKKKKKTVAKKKKEWNPNPWAVCHTTVDKDKEPEKFERCVKKVKQKQKACTVCNIRR